MKYQIKFRKFDINGNLVKDIDAKKFSTVAEAQQHLAKNGFRKFGTRDLKNARFYTNDHGCNAYIM